MMQLFRDLGAMAPAGYSAGLHIRYATPLVFRSTYPRDWAALYAERAFHLRDPVVFWGLGTIGTLRWSEITLPDPMEVMSQAAAHGMGFGAASAYGPATSRSIVGIARNDREFDDAELALLAELTAKLHIAARPPNELTPAQVDALRAVAPGARHSDAAAALGISESSLKARLKSARIRLEARTTAEAIRKAREFRLL